MKSHIQGNRISIYCDGFLKYKSYQKGCSVAVFDNSISYFSKKIFVTEKVKKHDLRKLIINNGVTSNVAEYFALYNSLRLAKKYDCNVNIFSDSMLAVMQFNNYWKCSNNVLRKWLKKCLEIRKDNINLYWVSRKEIVKILGH